MSTVSFPWTVLIHLAIKHRLCGTGISFALPCDVVCPCAEKISNTKIVGPSTLLIAGNSSANLTCQTTPGSLNTMEWQKDGKPLVPSSSVIISADKTSVFISPVQRTDYGEYQCKVTNPVSTDTASYKMSVICEYKDDVCIVTLSLWNHTLCILVFPSHWIPASCYIGK